MSIRSGQIERAIYRYKYEGRWGWRAIFGRILVGFLARHSAEFGPYDAIIPSPTFTGPGSGREFDHTREIVAAAEVEEPIAWPFEYDMVVKRAPTERFATTGAVKPWIDRKRIAEGPLRAALHVPTPDRVRGRRILVVDDVFTEGFTIREVAKALLDRGAVEVSEVVLARQPFRC